MAEYFDEVVLDAEDLEKLFQAATEFVRTMRNLSDEKKLAFYALYKQVSPLNFFKISLPLVAYFIFLKTCHNTFLSSFSANCFFPFLYKAKEGPCNTSRPGFWDVVGRAKW